MLLLGIQLDIIPRRYVNVALDPLRARPTEEEGRPLYEVVNWTGVEARSFLDEAKKSCREKTGTTIGNSNSNSSCLGSYARREVLLVSSWKSGSTFLSELIWDVK